MYHRITISLCHKLQNIVPLTWSIQPFVINLYSRWSLVFFRYSDGSVHQDHRVAAVGQLEGMVLSSDEARFSV